MSILKKAKITGMTFLLVCACGITFYPAVAKEAATPTDAGSDTVVIEQPDGQDIDTEQAEPAASGIYAESYITINEKNFPDANFRAALSKMYDTDGDGRLEADRTYLSVNGKGIKSLKGVELFKSLTHLECSEN